LHAEVIMPDQPVSRTLDALPATIHDRLNDQLTVGCTYTAMATRPQRPDTSTMTVLWMLATAADTLRAARTLLGSEDGADEARAVPPIADATLPAHWADLLASGPPGLPVLLDSAAGMARDVGRMARAGATVAELNGCLTAALGAIGAVRDGVVLLRP
jgi:hypothetical protein